jgi:hypothetical protein
MAMWKARRASGTLAQLIWQDMMMNERSATVGADAAKRVRGCLAVGVLGALLVVGTLASAVHAQPTSAVVEGAARINVRRGPSTKFPRVATVGQGDRVDVEGLEGEWAHIRTADGKTGYIRSVFLAPSGGAPAGRGTPTAGEAGNGAASAPAAASPVATPRGTTAVTPETLPSAPVHSGETEAEAVRRLQGELARVTAELEATRRQLDRRETEPAPLPGAAPSGGMAADSGELFNAGMLGLVAIGLLLSWLMGVAVGRRQERKRRTRIRF